MITLLNVALTLSALGALNWGLVAYAKVNGIEAFLSGTPLFAYQQHVYGFIAAAGAVTLVAAFFV